MNNFGRFCYAKSSLTRRRRIARGEATYHARSAYNKFCKEFISLRNLLRYGVQGEKLSFKKVFPLRIKHYQTLLTSISLFDYESGADGGNDCESRDSDG